LRPWEFGAQLLEHAAAGLDRGELVGIADQDDLGSTGDGAREELVQVGGADHGGLVDHQNGEAVHGQLVVFDLL
jgi:hypothetical protein